MQMKFLKKMGILFTLAALTSTQGVYADVSSSDLQHHVHINRHQIWGQFSQTWHAIAGDLNTLFLDLARFGLTADTEALISSYNSGSLVPQVNAFVNALINAGVSTSLAQNVGTNLNLYITAAESYAAAIGGSGDQFVTGAAWNVQTQNLIAALDNLPRVQADIIAPLIQQFQIAQILTIQADAIPNYGDAVLHHNEAQALAEFISDYLARRILH